MTSPLRARFRPVADADALANVFVLSDQGPTVLFLHDPDCPISLGAYEEVELIDADVHLVDVSSQHELSTAIQAYTGVRHESPQVFVLRERQPAWHASHGRIRTASVSAALASRGH